jgi:hypothetical protein
MLNAGDRFFMMPFVVDYKSYRISRKKWKNRVCCEDFKFMISPRYGVTVLLESCCGKFCIMWDIYELEAVINSEWFFSFLLKITLSLKLMFL